MHGRVRSSCDPACVTHFVLTCEGLPQCGLVLRWQNRKGIRGEEEAIPD